MDSDLIFGRAIPPLTNKACNAFFAIGSIITCYRFAKCL